MPNLLSIAPTVLLTQADDGLRQLVRVTIANPAAATSATLLAEWSDGRAELQVDLPAHADSTHDFLLPEPTDSRPTAFSLVISGTAADRRTVTLAPPPHLRVHVVQHSHHDVGYTDLASSVLREHCGFLDDVLAHADATSAYPPDARFRLVIEQAWSLLEYVRTAPPDRIARLADLLRRGDLELTALFGNLTTELCGPEEMVRALYPSFRLARQFGIPIVTAEHNDVPGLSWGLAEVLTAAGIRFFCPQLPRYWSWCDPPMQGFWDEAILFPQGRPAGFWWQAPSGRRVLLWDNFSTGGDVRADLPDLADRLQSLADGGYPYQSVYWPVRGAGRDNSPYIAGFCDTVREWNDRWAFPRLLSSTNALFFDDLEPELPAGLPTFAGELPGQDYPVGSMSTSAATSVNRATHVQLLVAESLATIAASTTDLAYPAVSLDRAYEDILWHDEHTWGHHFPAGPTAAASEVEKAVHAYRAAALAHDVSTRALARLADHVDLPGPGLYLVVWNPLPHVRTTPVSTPLREIENCGGAVVDSGSGYLHSVALTDRGHLHPPADIVAGAFDLIDLATGETVAFEIADLDADSAVPFAPQRVGLAWGTKRYGYQDAPSGVGRDLSFLARDLPAVGYKTYQLRPHSDPRPARIVARTPGLAIENEFFRVEVDPASSRVSSIVDLTSGRELLDPDAPHAFGELVVRTPDAVLDSTAPISAPQIEVGPVSQSLHLFTSAPGHPHVRQSLTLHRGVDRLDFSLRVLKDPTPLLDVHLAFPFLLTEPRFRYESLLALQTPLADFLPGAYWDEVAVQNWVRLADPTLSLLWSSLDAPMVSLGRLTEGYTSPAHSCRVPERIHHTPAGADQLAHAWLYSLLCANNFGTNFAVSQSGSLLFRYSLTAAPALTDADAVRLGWDAVTPCATIFTEPRLNGHLPPTASLLSLDGDSLVVLALKHADDGSGLVLRLWNPLADSATSTVRLGFGTLRDARLVSPVEEYSPAFDADLLSTDAHSFTLRLAPQSLATVHLTLEARA